MADRYVFRFSVLRGFRRDLDDGQMEDGKFVAAFP
jgi:hypothetical protein